MNQNSERQEETSIFFGETRIELGSPIDEKITVGDLLIVLLNVYDLPSDHPSKGKKYCCAR